MCSDNRIYYLVETWNTEGHSMEFLTTKQAAELWGISARRVVNTPPWNRHLDRLCQTL